MLGDNEKSGIGCGMGRRFKERGDICIFMADSHRCVAETNTTL